MKTIRVTLFGAIFLLLTACASLGLEPAGSFQDRVDYANSNLTALALTTTQALAGQRISVNEAKSVREVANQAKVLLDAATAVGDVPEGQQNLSLAIALLQNIQTYLNDRSKT